MRITEVRVTPIAVPDVPLVNTKGVHQKVFLRSVIELVTDNGLVGLGEAYGARRTLAGLAAAVGHPACSCALRLDVSAALISLIRYHVSRRVGPRTLLALW